MMHARRDVDLDADRLVIERRDRLRLHAPAAMGENVVTGTGTRSPKRPARHAFGGAQLRVGEDPRRAVVFSRR